MNKIDRFEGEYAFLSNFYPSPIFSNIDEITYPTVEHYFQAQKTIKIDERRTIAAAPTPGKAKRLGRKVALRSDWEFVKLHVMRIALQKKFSKPDLRQMLLATGDAKLIEGTTWGDTFWGIDLKTGEGKNHLGKLLMELREELKKENV